MQKLTFIGLILLITSCKTGGNTNPDITSVDLVESVDNTGLPADTTPENKVDSSTIKALDSDQINTATTHTSSEFPENQEIAPIHQSEPLPQKIASIAFDQLVHDFGRIVEGEVIEHTFNFTNQGKSPLVIKDALATCGCTVPEYAKEPVLPGASGSVKIVFDTQGRLGSQEKLITIVTNGSPTSQILRMKGTVATD